MTDHPSQLTIELPFFNGGVTPRGFERLPVEALSQTHYRLIHSPGMVEGLAAGDEISLTPDRLPGYTLLRRARNLCVWFYFPDTIYPVDTRVQHLQTAIEAIGGYLDGGGQRLLVFTIPVAVGFSTIERSFDVACQNYPGAVWMFGNVYDPQDGQTPLRWWEA